MNQYLLILLITALTGVGGLALGGAAAAAIHSPTNRTVSLMLRFTAGVMLSVVCFDLVNDARETHAATTSLLLWILVGYFCTYLLNCWVDKQAHHSHSHGGHSHGGPHQHAHDGHEHYHHIHGEVDHDHCHAECHHHEEDHSHHGPDEMCACGGHTLHTAGLVMAAAVALHNVPVGMAIGATFAGENAHAGAGALAALIIGLHNIPEGMSIAAPLLTSGARARRAVALAALSGVPTILGALLGYTVGAMDPATLAISQCFAAGAMLYVIFGELLPESEHLWQNRLSGLATMLGLLLGMLLIFSGHGHIHLH